MYFGPVRIDAVFDSKSLLDFLISDLEPWVNHRSATRFQEGGADIYLKVRRISEADSLPKKTKPILLYNREIPGYGNCWHAGDQLVVHDPIHRCQIFCNGKGQFELQYWASEFDCFRAIRMVLSPLIYQELDRKGGIMLHASAVELNDRGIVFCGPKGAGKTTCALNLSMISGCRFNSNDYIGLLSDDKGTLVLGAPEPIRIADGTFKALGNWLDSYRSAPVTWGKKQIFPREINQLMQVAPVIPLTMVCFIQLTDGRQLIIEPEVRSKGIDQLFRECLQISGYKAPQIVNMAECRHQTALKDQLYQITKDVIMVKLQLPRHVVGSKVLEEALIEKINSINIDSPSRR